MADWLNNLTSKAAEVAEDVALSVNPSGTVSSFLDGIIEKQPELEDILSIVQADENLTAAIANLRLQNPETLDKIMTNFTGGEETNPEALESAQAFLSNDVLRGQLTEVINNIANDENITDQNITNLLEAGEAYKTAVEGMGLTGIFGMAVLGTENEELNAARDNLVQSYLDLGMTEEDANAAIEQGWIMGINQKIDGLDNFGSMLSGGINGLLFNLGPLLDAIGLGPILRQMGIDTNFGVADILGQETADKIQTAISPATDWMEANLDLNIVDGIEAANINSLPEFIQGNIESVGFQSSAPSEAIEFEDHFDPEAITNAPGVQLSFGNVTNPVMSPEEIARTQDPAVTQSGQSLSFG